MQIIGIILIILVIALYLIWILYTKNQSGVSSKNQNGKQEFDITVKGVYSPALIKAKKGLPVKINFLRQEDTACSRFVTFSDFEIRKELPEGKKVSIEFTPNKSGEYSFTCDMGMYQGKLIVK